MSNDQLQNPVNVDMDKIATRLALAKQLEAIATEVVKRRKLELEQDTLYQQALGAKQEAIEARQRLEDALRDAALAQYQHNGEKSLHYSVLVKVITSFTFDEQAATAWAKEEAKHLLRIDDKQFTSLMRSDHKAKRPLPAFVEVVETPRADIQWKKLEADAEELENDTYEHKHNHTDKPRGADTGSLST